MSIIHKALTVTCRYMHVQIRVVPSFFTCSLPESCEDLVIDVLQDVFRCIQLNEEHDENPVIRKLLKLCHSHNVILQQNPSHNSQDLSMGAQYTLFKHSTITFFSYL